MKKIISHTHPHLDEVCAAWLFKKYLPEFKDAEIGFIPIDEKGGRCPDDPDAVCVGVGRGRFDEHKGDIGECAASLVFAHIKECGVKFEPLELRALEKLVNWVRLGDTGQLNKIEWHDFTVAVILNSQCIASGHDQASVMRLGFSILDALLESQKNAARLEADWPKRVEFESDFGRAVALITSAREADSYAFSHGFDVAVYINEERTYHNIRAAADSRVDLAPIYAKIVQVEPAAGWFLHHSKKMIICGGELTGYAKRSKLTLEWIIDLLTPNYVRERRIK